MGEIKRILRPERTLATVADDARIVRSLALADDVADDIGDATIGKVQFVGGLAARPSASML